MKKFSYGFYLLTLPCLIIGGSQAPINRIVDPKLLTGNISLTLSQAVWKNWQDKPVYQNLTLDLVCNNSQCRSQVWGFAPKYNKEVDHRGTARVKILPGVWRIEADVNIQPHLWNERLEPAKYIIEIVPYKDGLLGSYRGEVNGKKLSGRVRGVIAPFWPVTLEAHQPLQAQEHPRLIFRSSQIESLREKARTPEGKNIIEQLQASLKTPIYYDGYAPNGGYHATGYCFLSLLEQKPDLADRAWEIVKKLQQNPGKRVLEQSTIVAGTALAYDLCYPYWSASRRQEIGSWLYQQGKILLQGGGAGWNGNAWSNWNGRAKAAGGLAALAILDDYKPQDNDHYSPANQVQLARRNIQRYIVSALGDGGFGTEGDHYTTEPMVLSVIPFVLAYRNVMGEDLVTGSNMERLIPQYYTRTIAGDDDLFIPAYGRHRSFMGKSLFSIGLSITPPSYLPGVLSSLNGVREGMFALYYPHIAPYIFAFDAGGIKRVAEPDKVFVDEQKGFYVFRSAWGGRGDFVSSIYLKRQALGGSWSFPDVGSFRIWGLNGKWAEPGASQARPIEENGLLVPGVADWRSSKPVAFASRLDGSGIITLQSRSSNITWLRSFAVDYSGSSGAPGLFVVVDKLSQPGPSTWVMNTRGKVTLNQNNFTIKDGDSNLQATFITPVRLSYERTTSGTRILARGEGDYYVVMTVQKGPAPKVTTSGARTDAIVKINKQEVSFSKDKIFLKVF